MVKGATKEALDKAWDNSKYLPLDDAFVAPRKATAFLSKSTCARVAYVAQSVNELLAQGCAPKDIVVLCATPAAVAPLHELLGKGVGESVCVMAARQLALDVLATPEGQAAIGRTFAGAPRLLSAFEQDFVLEDVKTMGMRAGRLRQLLGFLYKGWTELSDECDDWLVTVEERDVTAFVRAELAYLQGVLEPEVSNFATKTLRRHEDVLAAFARAHVFVLDYQNMSRASQLLCNLVARESITIAACEGATIEAYESYPFADGVAEFSQVNAGAEVLHDESAAPATRTSLWNTPEEEIEHAVSEIAAQLAQGECPEGIGVACFHPYWHKQVTRALQAQGICTSGMPAPLALKADVRDLHTALPLRVVSALRLMDNPQDSVSWRCWFGYGDYLGRSAEFVAQRERLQAENPDVHFADAVQQEPFYDQVLAFLSQCKRLGGGELVEHIVRAIAADGTRDIPGMLKPLCQLGADVTASDMVRLLERQQFFHEAKNKGCVCVSSFEDICSCGFKSVYVVGFVNGFFPKHRYFDRTQVTINQQTAIEETDTRRATALAGCAKSELVLGGFRHVQQEVAERCSVKQDRIFIAPDGTRFSEVSMSMYAPLVEELNGR